jgi:hypothetical protein
MAVQPEAQKKGILNTAAELADELEEQGYENLKASA